MFAVLDQRARHVGSPNAWHLSVRLPIKLLTMMAWAPLSSNLEIQSLWLEGTTITADKLWSVMIPISLTPVPSP